MGDVTLKITLNFKKPDKDKITLKVRNGTGPAPPLASADVTVNVCGAEFTGTLDDKGKYKSADKNDSIKIWQKQGLWNGNVKRKRGDFQADLANCGLIDADIEKPGDLVTVPVSIGPAAKDVNIFYTSKLGKKGKAK